MKVVCAPQSKLPRSAAAEVEYFSLYSSPGRKHIGTIAPGWPAELAKDGFAPCPVVWDFVSIGLAAAAADLSCSRKKSTDGWTRVIDLEIYLHDPAPFTRECRHL